MKYDKSTTVVQLDYAIRLSQGLPAALLAYVDALPAIRQRLEQLEGKVCTGHTHWRDKNTPGKSAKLYVLHGTNQACPIHGAPVGNARIRCYIGNKPDKIADALAAIERKAEQHDLQQDLNHLMGKVSRVIWEIKSLYRALGYLPPTLEGDPATTTARLV